MFKDLEKIIKVGDMIYCHTTLLMSNGQNEGTPAFNSGIFYKINRICNNYFTGIEYGFNIIDELGQEHSIGFDGCEKWFDLQRIIRKKKLEKIGIGTK